MPKSTTTKSLFLKDESSFGGLSKITGALHLINSQNALDCLAREINEIARRARVSRQSELCRKASAAVLHLPVSDSLRGIAEFYASLSQRADNDEFRHALARRADGADPSYLARVILELACTYDYEGNVPEALWYYVEATKAATGTDSLTAVQAAAGMTLLRSDDGDHLGALQEFKRLFPIIRSVSHTYSHVYYEYANNLAVVLSKAGRIEEARHAVRVALASPLAPRFPEWSETASEIEEAARKESPKSAPTLKIAVAASSARLREAQHLRAAKPPRVLFVAVIKFVNTPVTVPPRYSNSHSVSLLGRYVKTVRIRDRP